MRAAKKIIVSANLFVLWRVKMEYSDELRLIGRGLYYDWEWSTMWSKDLLINYILCQKWEGAKRWPIDVSLWNNSNEWMKILLLFRYLHQTETELMAPFSSKILIQKVD